MSKQNWLAQGTQNNLRTAQQQMKWALANSVINHTNWKSLNQGDQIFFIENRKSIIGISHVFATEKFSGGIFKRFPLGIILAELKITNSILLSKNDQLRIKYKGGLIKIDKELEFLSSYEKKKVTTRKKAIRESSQNAGIINPEDIKKNIIDFLIEGRVDEVLRNHSFTDYLKNSRPDLHKQMIAQSSRYRFIINQVRMGDLTQSIGLSEQQKIISNLIEIVYSI